MKFTAKFVLIMILPILSLGLAAPLLAQDLTDNETCLECHADAERSEPADPNMVQVHSADGGFNHEAHEMWSCVDCHTYIEEIPHPEGVGDMSVDCLNCHEEVPQN